MSDNLEKFAFKMVHMQGFFNFKALTIGAIMHITISTVEIWARHLSDNLFKCSKKNAIAEADNF